ncbi:ubiquitin-conjugating enzyme E2 G1-like [Asterias rubens]|uniref:ubiquitin-conjugating enzyme E2 G1-like n=1 Tax=Asterias rubens TaxID=7604 RepID=UPI0014554FEB|nr:ubiquitin-conjugating enzyme E2 G1-like [Asterias rubens]
MVFAHAFSALRRDGHFSFLVFSGYFVLHFHLLTMATTAAAMLLKKQLQEFESKGGTDGFSAGLSDDDNLFRWEVIVYGPSETFFEGGFFKAELVFPENFPNRPPKMKFLTDMWHPNIAKNGDVCISILHEPGDDKWGYETASERWRPVHSIESILISVISMLSNPNDESPANVDAGKEWREDYNGAFKRNVLQTVKKSQQLL